MKHVKWIFIVFFISVLTSFISKDRPTEGLNIGDIAPNFNIETISGKQKIDLKSLKGKYILLSFWASYDAPSRIINAGLSEVLQSSSEQVEMLSVSFDEYRSVFDETIRKDRVTAATCFVDTKGTRSPVYRKYNLNHGFTTYLLDSDGIIVAKNISVDDISSYIR